MNYLVTGGAGFIGSHVVDEIIRQGDHVLVYDNFSTGHEEFIRHHLNNPLFKLVKADVLDNVQLAESMKDIDFVFHFAAHADVRSGYQDHFIDHRENLESTQSVLEAMYTSGVKKIAFSSTSSVYGDATIHPTPETYPFEPTSLYGATKAACESYIQAYTSYYDMQAYIFRFVSFIGERYTHGIMVDILEKLRTDKNELHLLSDGTPKKSSLYVLDGVNAMFTIIKKADEAINIYNIGHDDIMTIDQIIDTILIAADERPKKIYQGGLRGWKGDNAFVHLDATKLKKLGWSPKVTFAQGIKKTIDYLNKE